MNTFSAAGLITVRDSGGVHLAVPVTSPLWVIITSNTNGIYGWYELQFAGNGTFSVNLSGRYGTSNYEPAYEVNGNDQVPVGTIVQLTRGFIGGNTSLSDYVKREWNFFYPSSNTPDGDTNLYAQLTNSTTVGGLLFYSFQEQTMLENGAWSNGALSGEFNAREFNNNNITIGSYVHLFKGYDSEAYANIQQSNSTIQTVEVIAAGGTFTLVFNNGTTSETTAGIAFNASIASVESALEALSNLTNCTVTGSASDYTVEFNDGLAYYPLMTYGNYLTANVKYVFNSDVGNGSTPGSITTNYLTVNNETVLYGAVIGNATTWDFYNNQSWSWYGIQARLYNDTLNETYNGTVTRNYNANVTLNLSGAFALTICGNTTLCANKTLTLPRIIGNDTSGKLRITSNSTANTTLPTALRVDNASLDMTMISTPPTPSAGEKGLYWDANGTLMGIDENGTITAVAATGNGTSNGSVGWVQLADGSGGFSATANATIDDGGNATFAGNVTVGELDGDFGTVVYSTGGLLGKNEDGGLSYEPGNAADWDSPEPGTLKDAIDRIAVLLAALSGGPIP